MIRIINRYFLLAAFLSIPAHAQFAGAAGEAAGDTLALPVIQIKPDYIEVERPDSGKYIECSVKVLNRGAQTLRVLAVQPSCYCANGKILNGAVDPMGLGKIQFSVNLDGMAPGTDTIEFVIKSNAKNSAVTAKMKILDKKNPESPGK